MSPASALPCGGSIPSVTEGVYSTFVASVTGSATTEVEGLDGRARLAQAREPVRVAALVAQALRMQRTPAPLAPFSLDQPEILDDSAPGRLSHRIAKGHQACSRLRRNSPSNVGVLTSKD